MLHALQRAHAQPLLLWCLCGSNRQLPTPTVWRRTEARTFLPKGFVDEENTMTGLVDQGNHVFKLAGGLSCCSTKHARLCECCRLVPQDDDIAGCQAGKQVLSELHHAR